VSQRAFATGSTLSGKTFRLRTLFADRVPRSLVLDSIGNPRDWLSWPGAIAVESKEQVAAALRDNAGRERWRIVWLTELDDPAVDEVLQLLVPSSPLGFSYADAVGGMALICDEVAEMMPNKTGELTRTRGQLWRRGRHRRLSLFAGTQRIPEVSRTVTAQSRYFICCPQNEPRDLETLGQRLPPHVLRAAQQLQPRHCVLWDAELMRGGLLDPDGRVLQALGPTP
jgi:hypothetical protein